MPQARRPEWLSPPPLPKRDAANATQSLDIQPLSESTDFSRAKTSPCLVEGKGQKVYWQNCWIKIYDKGEADPKEEIEVCSGWATVPGDVEVGFSGPDGCVKVGG